MDKNIPTNNWREGMQGIVQPVEMPNEFTALDPRAAERELHERAAEIEKIAHDNAMNNPINLANQMYDLMAQYHKKIEY